MSQDSLKDLPTIGLTSAYNFIPSKNTCDFLSTKCFMIFIPKGLFEIKKVHPPKKKGMVKWKVKTTHFSSFLEMFRQCAILLSAFLLAITDVFVIVYWS
jgi:hypothetical protein